MTLANRGFSELRRVGWGDATPISPKRTLHFIVLDYFRLDVEGDSQVIVGWLRGEQELLGILVSC
uniref:Uncharacterized protein n=1 Tax=Nelumbo nucifera TaxID=4432 RepID=A0A822YHZ0_NELNU|nr:TPA_asm: hypothetical protein HUJ06_010594 [Nelumbo nucifera]